MPLPASGIHVQRMTFVDADDIPMEAQVRHSCDWLDRAHISTISELEEGSELCRVGFGSMRHLRPYLSRAVTLRHSFVILEP